MTLPQKLPHRHDYPSKKARRAKWVRKYLAALRETGLEVRSAELAGVAFSTVWRLRESDSNFQWEYDLALREAAEKDVAESIRRGREGVDEPQVYKGQIATHCIDADGNPGWFVDSISGEICSEDKVGAVPAPGCRLVNVTVRKYSDSLLLARLKAEIPERYDRASKLEVSGHVSHAHIVLQPKDLQQLSDDQLTHLLTGNDQLVIDATPTQDAT